MAWPERTALRTSLDQSRNEQHVFPTTDLRLRAYAQVLLRHRVAILVVIIAVVVIGVTPTLLEDASYASTASMRVRAEGVESPFDTSNQPNAQNRSRELLTDVEIIESARMRGLVLDRLGDDAEPFGSVSASVVGFSEVIEVRVTAPTPSAAAAAANVYAEVFVEERRKESVDAIVSQSAELRRRVKAATDQLADVDRQLAAPDIDPVVAENLRVTRAGLSSQVLEFSTRADELDVEAALREGGTEIVTKARENPSPVSPKPWRTAVTALALGLLAGVAAAVALEISQDRLAGADDLASVDPSIDVLGSIPRFPSIESGRVSDPAAVVEAFKYLRTAVTFRSVDEPIKSIMVTSAVKGEGKTTTAVHLARAVADTGSRVVLLEADLRRPAMAADFGLVGELGLINVFSGEATLSDAIHHVQPNLAVVPAGGPSPTANELLGSAAFVRLVEGVAARCDLLVIDVPPVLPVADPLVVARRVDGTIVVSRIGQVRRREIRSVVRLFRDARLPIIGFVANDSVTDSEYGDYVADPGPG